MVRFYPNHIKLHFSLHDFGSLAPYCKSSSTISSWLFYWACFRHHIPPLERALLGLAPDSSNIRTMLTCRFSTALSRGSIPSLAFILVLDPILNKYWTISGWSYWAANLRAVTLLSSTSSFFTWSSLKLHHHRANRGQIEFVLEFLQSFLVVINNANVLLLL